MSSRRLSVLKLKSRNCKQTGARISTNCQLSVAHKSWERNTSHTKTRCILIKNPIIITFTSTMRIPHIFRVKQNTEFSIQFRDSNDTKLPKPVNIWAVILKYNIVRFFCNRQCLRGIFSVHSYKEQSHKFLKLYPPFFLFSKKKVVFEQKCFL